MECHATACISTAVPERSRQAELEMPEVPHDLQPEIHCEYSNVGYNAVKIYFDPIAFTNIGCVNL